MYHIKPDKRSQASAEQIVQGMRRCLGNQPLKAITVSDLHRATGISRATFYRLFDTPEDVLRYHYDQLLSRDYDRTKEYTPRELFENAIAMGMENHEFLKAMVDNGRFDLLFQYTEKSFRMMDASGALFPEAMDPVQRECTISHLAMAMVATLITWARNGRRESAAEVVQYLKEYVKIVSALIGEE